MKLLIILLLMIASAGARPADQQAPLPLERCRAEALYGFPSAPGHLRTARECRRAYVLEYDVEARVPVWVAYTLTPEHAVGCLARTNRYAADQSLPPDAQVAPEEYAWSGYDRGHLADAGDMRWDREALDESFIMTNLAPQRPAFNRGVWKRLEDAVRGWAVERGDELQVYVGPVYNQGTDPTLGGAGRVTVPHAFFKVVIDTRTSEVMAFLIRNEGSRAELGTFMVGLNELQQLTGLTLPVPPGTVLRMPPGPTFSAWPWSRSTGGMVRAAVCGRPG